MMQTVVILALLQQIVAATTNGGLFSLTRQVSTVTSDTVQDRADAIERGDTKLSYSGDLEDIFALAKALAEEDASSIPVPGDGYSTSPSSAPNSVDESASISIKSCAANFTYEQVEEITFTYSMESMSAYSTADVQSSLEQAMNNVIAKEFLNCDVRLRRRSLVITEIDMTAVNSLPVDTPSKDAICNSTNDATNKCTIVDGVMDVYLGSETSSAMVKYTIRSFLSDYLPSADVKGLVIARYLEPVLTDLSEINTNGGDAPLNAASAERNLSARSIVLFSFAAVAVVSAMGAAIWFKKVHNSNRNDSDEMTSTVAPFMSPLGGSGSGPDMAPISVDNKGENDDFLADTGSDSRDALSPFSSMLPNAYRLEQGVSQMDVVLELNESYDDQASSILISEGWTTDSEVDSEEIDLMIDTSRSSDGAVLGARKRKDEGSGNLLPPLEMP